MTTSTSDSAYTSVLSLSSVALTDAGTYTCTGTYALSDGTSQHVLTQNTEVVVRGFKTNPADQNIDLGAQLVISCVVIGDQQASVTWYVGLVYCGSRFSGFKHRVTRYRCQDFLLENSFEPHLHYSCGDCMN